MRKCDLPLTAFSRRNSIIRIVAMKNSAAGKYPLAESWKIFIEYYPLFKKLERALTSQPWFSDGWIIYTGHFSEGIFLQLYKAEWHNHNQRGIHLETWVSIDGVRNGSVPVVLHVEREAPYRKGLNHLLVERGTGLMTSWPGYSVSCTNVMERFIHRFPLSRNTLVKRLTEEFTRVQEIGDVIDGVLAELSGAGNDNGNNPKAPGY